MVDTLGAVLQGLNNGAATGLDMYKTMREEERLKRNEAYRLSRDAIEDTRYDSEQTYKMERDRVADGQAERTFKENQRQFNVDLKFRQQDAAAGRALQSRQIKISEDTYRDGKLAEEMKLAQARVQAAMVDPATGQLITDPVKLNQRLRETGADDDMGRVLAYIDPDRFGRGNYTGVKGVATPQGIGVAVSGTDLEGKPINGWAPATENGSANDTDVPVDTYDQAAFILANPNLIPEIQANNLQRMERERLARENQSVVDSRIRSGKGDAEGIKEAETRLAAAQQGLQAAGELPKQEQPGFARLATSLAGQYGIEPAVSERDQKLTAAQQEVKAAQEELNYRASLRSAHEGYGKRELDAQFAGLDRQRATLGGAGFLKQRQTAIADAPKLAAEEWKAWGTERDNILKNVAIPTKKSKNDDGFTETTTPVSKADLQAQLDNLPPEIQRLARTDRSVNAALTAYTQFMAEKGQKTGMIRFIDAARQGVDLGEYVKVVNDVAMNKGNGWSDDQVHAFALKQATGGSAKESLAAAGR